MNDFFSDAMFSQPLSGTTLTISAVLLVLLLAFALGQLIAWVYMWTHTGLSYSATFTASLIVICVMVSMVMLLMAGNLYIAFGMMAVFAVVRFRNVLKDTRDTSFVLWTIIQGMAVGTQKYEIAVVGCLFIALVVLYVWATSIGNKQNYDVVLSLHLSGEASAIDLLLLPLLRRHSNKVQLASQRSLTDDMMDLSYRLALRDPSRTNDLMGELEATEGVAHVSLYQRENESEI